jgi:hypothetical protein
VSFSQEKGFSVGMLVNILDLGLQEVTYLSFSDQPDEYGVIPMKASNEILQAMGCTNFETLEGISKNVIQARVKHREYTTDSGETKMGLRVWLQKSRTIFKQAASPDDRRAFAAMMKQVGAQLPAGGGAPGAAAGPKGYPQNWDAPGAPAPQAPRPGFKL